MPSNTPSKIHPDTDNHTVNLDILNNFANYVLTANPMAKNEADLAKTREDALKVIENLKFIKVNLEYIAYAVEHQAEKNNRAIYKYPNDAQTGVIRDFNDTSMHIFTYNSSEKAVNDLKAFVSSFETAIENMEQAGELLNFVSALEYDKDKGCIEARTERALQFAAQTMSRRSNASAIIDVDQEMQKVFPHFNDEDNDKNFAAAVKHFEKAFGTLCNISIRKEPVTLTPALLIEYFNTILGQDLSEDVIKHYQDNHPHQQTVTAQPVAVTAQPVAVTSTTSVTTNTSTPAPNTAQAISESVLHQQYQQLTQGKCEIKTGYTGMIQHWFTHKTDADHFTRWLKSQSALKAHGIDKANVKKENLNNSAQASYVVRLSSKQLSVITLPAENSNIVSANKTSSQPQITTKLEFKNSTAPTLYQLLDDYEMEKYQQALQAISPGELDKQLPQQHGSSGLTLLHLAAKNSNEKQFRMLINKAGIDALTKAAMIRENANNTTGLLAVLCYQPLNFMMLFNKLPLENKQIFDNELANSTLANTFMHLLITTLPIRKNTFLHILQRFSIEKLTTLALAYTSQGDKCNLLQQLAQTNDYEASVDYLVTNFSSNTLNKLALHKNAASWNLLHSMLRYQSAATVITLLDKLADDTVQTLVLEKTKQDTPVLFVAASYQPSASFMALIKRLDSKSLETALFARFRGQWVLGIILNTQSAKAVELVLSTLSNEAINNIVAKATSGSILLSAARKQLPSVFKMLIDKTDGDALRWHLMGAAAKFSSMCNYQSKEMIQHLLQKLPGDYLSNVLLRDPANYSGYVLQYLTEILLDQHNWDSQPEFIQRLLIAINKNASLKLVLLKKIKFDFNRAIIKTIPKTFIDFVCDNPIDPSKIKNASNLATFYESIKNHAPIQDIKIITLGNKKPYAIDDLDTINQDLWQYGAVDAMQLRYLRLVGNTTTLKIIQRLQDAGLATSGMGEPLTVTQAHLLAETPAESLFKQGKIFIKVLNDERWGKYVEMFEKHPERIDLRKPREPEYEKYKYKHLENKIIPYDKNFLPRPHTPADKDERRDYSKKNSATYINSSPDNSSLNTRLFGQFDKDNQLVGVALNIDKIKLKMMLARDNGTYARDWVTQMKNQVENYADYIQDISYPDFESFKQAVAANPQWVNEVLLKAQVASHVAIVIGRDTKEARAIAVARQQQFLKKFKVELPIIFYDNQQHFVREYSKAEIYDDSVSQRLGFTFNSLLEQRAKKQLLMLKQQLTEHTQWHTFGFWEKMTWAKLPKAASGALRLIAAAEDAEKSNYPKDKPYTWEKMHAQVKRFLAHQQQIAQESNDNDKLTNANVVSAYFKAAQS
ncbi:MAG: hypothetical protein Tsb005_19150 [Gammaproteobacteria bacterium]